MRHNLGFFSDAKALNNEPKVNQNVGVRIELGCSVNKGFYVTLLYTI